MDESLCDNFCGPDATKIGIEIKRVAVTPEI